MAVTAPYTPLRLHSLAVAEVCGVVAGHKPVRISNSEPSLARSISKLSILEKHGRSLEILRTILGARAAGEHGEEQWDGALAEKRQGFVDALRELQHPQAEAIGHVHALLDNRAQLGLVSAGAAREYVEERALGGASLASSLASEESASTLDSEPPRELLFGEPAWERRFRGRSISSERTCVDARAEPDTQGVCWPLGAAAGARAHVGSFFADLGEVRVPSRFRVPQHSLGMLACEQRMVGSDKIVCPLKNRLQEVNPRRQAFEDYVRATGCIPPPPAAARRPSPLRFAC
ncbi:hypothetical protein IWW50_005918 [Coemansia erecta]|nr:hypothetical protein GGF43_006042 [Coemansia sp. RSA 2618]KAJ2818145.1 hypothetical protein IWW50_005918 [Coemansia erecta]